jgi:MFS family permease
MNSYQHTQNRRRVVIGGACIMAGITLLSCVSSFTIYRQGFADFPAWAQNALGLVAVVVVEGAFAWLLFGYRSSFSSWLERLIALIGIGFIIGAMLMNIATHFMQAKHVPLATFQQHWVDFGAVFTFIAVLLLVLAITLADPVVRIVRLELRYTGRQQESILRAKNDALRSDRIIEAMANRANIEAAELAELIEGEADRKRIGFGSVVKQENDSLD